MNTRNLRSDELGVTKWQMQYDESIWKWIVFRMYDTVDKDFETGEPCFGAAFDVQGEYASKEEAEYQLEYANNNLLDKAGYVVVDTK
jgi:hypothetical protein